MVMIIMVFSRLMSLLSVQIYLAVFGTSGNEINIYSFALNIPNIVFACFGTAVSTVVIPMYAGLRSIGEHKRADYFANNLLTTASVFTLGLILIGELISPVIPKFTDYSTPDRGYWFAVKALMILFPVMIFYTLNYIFQGILQSRSRFLMPAAVSIPSSLVVIIYTLALGDRYGVQGLLIATLFGLSLQALILIPPLIKSGFKYKPVLKLKDKDMVAALKLTPNVLIGTSAYQLNMLFNITLAANFDNKVTLLTYTQYIVLYSVLALVYSVTAVIYPKLSALFAADNIEGYKNVIIKVIRNIAFLLLPITAGFIAVRTELIDLLARWGKVTHDDVSLAGTMLALYAAGIIGIGIKEVLDRAFYAAKDTKTPAINSIAVMAVNISSSIILTRFFGIVGIPSAYSISSVTGGIILIILIKRKFGSFFGPEARKAIVCMLLASAAVFAAASLAGHLTGVLTEGLLLGDGIFTRIIKLAVPVLAGALTYAAVCALLKIEEAIVAYRKLAGILSRLRVGFESGKN